MSRLRDALAFLGALHMHEAVKVLRLSPRQIRRLARVEQIGRDDEGRLSLRVGRVRPPPPCFIAVRALVADGSEVYADWLCEQTGFGRRAVYEALRSLGYTSRRGRNAVWRLDAVAAK